METLATQPYDCSRTYRWNYDHPPVRYATVVPDVPGTWDFCGIPVPSPLGVAAGPLLNGHWCLYYADLGFDVLTYKTVRSRQRDCYEMPNLQPVDVGMIAGSLQSVSTSPQMQGSWAVSFGMPSSDPSVWRRDIEWTKDRLPAGKVLNVSVVASAGDDWSIDQLADDYAQCARWAVESGADCVETNFSCPNVSTCDGQLYQNPAFSRVVAQRVRDAIGNIPLIIKVGHLLTDESVDQLLDAVGTSATALSMTNSIASRVTHHGELMFQGERRGICGHGTRDESIQQVARFASIITRDGLPLKLIGVGGISTAADVRSFLDAGAHSCHLATAAMLNSEVALEIRRELFDQASPQNV